MSSFAAAATRVGLAPIAITTTGNGFRDQTEFEDEVQQLSLTSQCVVVRAEGSLDPAAYEACPVPIINAGDGNNEHPTQTLIDLAVMRHFGLEGRTVAIMGNLRDHRTSHSLVLALRKLRVRVRLLSPRALPMGDSYLDGSEDLCFVETRRERDECLRDVDFVYLLPTMSLTSPPRIFEDVYSLDLDQATRALKGTAKVLHPFPRFGELHKSLDYTTFDAYHLQTSLGPSIREKVLRRLLWPDAARDTAPEAQPSFAAKAPAEKMLVN
jgi:aspartate carbamoyltransferase catalytic subunit